MPSCLSPTRSISRISADAGFRFGPQALNPGFGDLEYRRQSARIDVELFNRSGDCRSITENLPSRSANGSLKLRRSYAPPALVILYRSPDQSARDVVAIMARAFYRALHI